MPRSTEEWIGKTDDAPVPPRVRLRTFERKKGKCHNCPHIIRAGEKWTCEHLVALINGGENRESNLNLTCCFCLPEKNAADVAEKSAIYEKRKKHLLPREPKYRWAKRRLNPPRYDNTRYIDRDAE